MGGGGMTMGNSYISAPERFWAQTDKRGEDECWLWTGCITSKGYGKIAVGKRQTQAHRYAYELTYGAIPEGMCCLHRCDVKACVNPRHLWLGTLQDNVNDMVARNRQAKGEAINAAKLNAVAVSLIRELHKRGVSYARIARAYRMRADHIADVCKRRYWRHIP